MVFDKNKPYNDLPFLPPAQDLESKIVLKQTIKSNKALAELKSRGRILPNQDVLLNNLMLLEAKDSSEIENIFTTHDKLYQADVIDESQVDPQTKEVRLYREALWHGLGSVKARPLSTNTFVEIFQKIKQTDAQIRIGTGTKISNPSKEIIYTPPEGEETLRRLLKNLEDYLHHEDDVDPLIKMAVMHYQFEAIHPFTDGNGRTGRILNILYLIEKKLLDNPVLFLSSYIINHKMDYYRGLRDVTESAAWENWILYMLRAVEETSYETISKIERIESAIENFSARCRERTNIYSKDLVELLFEQPYCKIAILASRLDLSRQTASTYLRKLEEQGLLTRFDIGNTAYYFNLDLFKALQKSDPNQ